MATDILVNGILAFGAAAIMGIAIGAHADDGALRGQLEVLKQRRIFFGHQSVGSNLIEGMKQLAAQEGISLQIVEEPSSLTLEPGTFAHAHVGSNGNPVHKLQSFERALNSGTPSAADIALVKFCYVDITPETDVRALFAKYQSTMAELQGKHPATRFVHVTPPLTTVQGGPKALVKRLLGKAPYGTAENARREEYSDLLRQTYQSKEPVFDLAAVESTRPDGTLETTQWNGRAVPALVSDYTDDGGHLNRTGQLHAARRLIALLATIPIGRPAATP